MVSEECAAVERPNLGSISEPPPQNVDREGPSHHVVAHGRHGTDGENETIS